MLPGVSVIFSFSTGQWLSELKILYSIEFLFFVLHPVANRLHRRSVSIFAVIASPSPPKPLNLYPVPSLHCRLFYPCSSPIFPHLWGIYSLFYSIPFLLPPFFLSLFPSFLMLAKAKLIDFPTHNWKLLMYFFLKHNVCKTGVIHLSSKVTPFPNFPIILAVPWLFHSLGFLT